MTARQDGAAWEIRPIGTMSDEQQDVVKAYLKYTIT